MKDYKILDEYDLSLYDKNILESFSSDIRQIYRYSEELEYFTYEEKVKYIDESIQKMEKIQRIYARKYPFLNTNRLMKTVQKLQICILDYDFLVNCVILENFPIYDSTLYENLSKVEVWQYLCSLNYNRLNKVVYHKESLLKVADMFFNLFVGNIYNLIPHEFKELHDGNTKPIKSRSAKAISSYLGLIDYISKYNEMIDLFENVKDIIDFEDVRVFISKYIAMIYKGTRYEDDMYPNLTPSLMVDCAMAMIQNFFESIESSLDIRDPADIVSEIMSDFESGELYLDDTGIKWLTNYEIEMVQVLFLNTIFRYTFDYAFDRIEQVMEDPHSRYQLKLNGFNNTQVKDRSFQASIKLVGYTLWYVFNKSVL